MSASLINPGWSTGFFKFRFSNLNNQVTKQVFEFSNNLSKSIVKLCICIVYSEIWGLTPRLQGQENQLYDGVAHHMIKLVLWPLQM